MTYLDLLPMPSLSLPSWYKNKQSVGRGCSSVPEVLGSDRGCCVEETTLQVETPWHTRDGHYSLASGTPSLLQSGNV